MHNDFDKIETELRQIEEDFEAGRMNAFGSKASQDAFIRELHRIADIESQVFYKTCAILKASNRSEHGVITNIFASAEASGQAGSAAMPTNSGPDVGMDGSMRFRNRSASNDYGGGVSLSPKPAGASALPVLRRGVPNTSGGVGLPRPLGHVLDDNVASVLSANRGLGRRSGDTDNNASATLEGGGEDGITGSDNFYHNTSSTTAGRSIGAEPVNSAGSFDGGVLRPEWGNEAGYADSAFEDVVGHFRLMESEFEFVGEHLRQISKHVMRLNDMSDQVNSTAPSNTVELSALRREATRSKRRAGEEDTSFLGAASSATANNNN